ncbi:MAG TPA: HNH endonuclease [Acidimicrobiia bacterium]|nr:HNH endonuclease [Acidimicrobiia bacterium]
MEGCHSRYRLQPHHIKERQHGGDHHPDNLVTLCWFHHHVVVHERGFRPFRHPEHGRIRFRPPDRPS